MKRITFSVLLCILFDSLFLIVSFLNIPSLQQRSTLPFAVNIKDSVTIVSKIDDRVKELRFAEGDTVLSVKDSLITSPEQLEFIADFLTIGSPVNVMTLNNNTVVRHSVLTVPFYPNSLYIIIIMFVGVSFLSVGLFVVWNRPREKIAHIFHWMMALVGTTIMITWGSIAEQSLQSLMIRSLFFVTYVFGIASFYLFTLLYCMPTPRRMLVRFTGVYLVACIFSFVMVTSHHSAIIHQSTTLFAQFQRNFDYFHGAIIVTFVAGVINVLRAYRRAESKEEKNRLEWIIWGFAISCSPFLLLYIIPQLLIRQYVIPEEYTTIFFIALPFSFGISFIKHHLFDIRLLIKRTIVNFLFSAIIAITYFIVVFLTAAFLNEAVLSKEQSVAVIITLFVAVALHPFRVILQRFIDRLLFKTDSAYVKIISDATWQLQQAVSNEQIYRAVSRILLQHLPVERLTLYAHEKDLLIPVLQENAAGNASPRLRIDEIESLLPIRLTAVASIVNAVSSVNGAINNHLPSIAGCELFVPISSSSIPLIGAMALSRIDTTERFNDNELSLLLAIGDLAGEHLDRLRMVEAIILEKEERNRANALNQLKSDFVSDVSHELQTPLTSIRLFSELLQKRVSGGKSAEQLNIITGEAERLSRMVNNLLDVTRIESGLKEYHFQPCPMNAIVNTVLAKMSYIIEKHDFSLVSTITPVPIMINADADALEQALMNLLSNAVKYSRHKRKIRVSLSKKHGFGICSVRDYGDGIPDSSLPHLFTRSYRSPEHRGTVKGFGLGLMLVKHIAEAHQGTITVRSALGKGSTFSLSIPMIKSGNTL